MAKSKASGSATIKPKNENPALHQTFETLRKVLAPYEKKLASRNAVEFRYELWTKNPVTCFKKTEPMFFASVILQKAFVGFYFMPVYVDVALKKEIHPDLLKKLKGKSCFHFKSTDEETLFELKEMLQVGFESYKAKGWV